MGISGLLPLLKSIQKPCHIKKFAGLTIGIDAYGWLHRGTVACAIDLALGKPTRKHIDFAVSRMRMLIHFGIIPFMIFDGDYLPSKALTELERAGKRAESRKVGLELYRMGKPSQAHLELQKAVDVSPEMARELIEELKTLNIQYIVAPYEADAQLVYLERLGIIQGILSEDSDLLVFGAKRLLTKLDQYGECIEINRDNFTACREISLIGWSDAEFRLMAILSGCDYLTNINKMGLKTAYRLVRKHKKIEKILRVLQFDGQYRVPPGYLEDFNKAELTFLHQRVYCPEQKKLVMATDLVPDYKSEFGDLSFLGKDVDAEVAQGVAKGDLHPMTKEPIVLTVHSQRLVKSQWTPSRKQSTVIPSSLQKGVTIAAYFKTQRTPLAELDPNSFTPSPSQRQLLERHNGTWPSSPAPVLSSASRSSPLVPVPTNSTASKGANLGLGRSINSSSSIINPPKRPRLCEDVSEEVGSEVEVGRSRYFASSAPLPSPSLRDRSKPKPKTTEINIWSDDSIDDALIELVETYGANHGSVKKSKIAVFRDDLSDQTREASSLAVINDAPSQAVESSSSTAEASRPSLPSTLASSLSDLKDSQRRVPASGKQVVLGSNTGLTRSLLGSSELKFQADVFLSESSDYIQSTPSPNLVPKLNVRGHRGLSTQKKVVASKHDSSQPSTQGSSFLEWFGRHKADGSLLPEPSASCSPDAIKSSTFKGSEDFLIPNSEDEDNEQAASDMEQNENSKPDLGRFAFKGGEAASR